MAVYVLLVAVINSPSCLYCVNDKGAETRTWVLTRVCQKNFFREFSSNQWDSHSFLDQFVPQEILDPYDNNFL